MMKRATVVLGVLATCAGVCACGASSSASSDPSGLAGAGTAALAAGTVAVSPMPGTPDASPATQISFLGPAGTRVLAARVVGSASGVHAGVLRAYSTGTGESFLPTHPFVEGERVTVSARVQAGGATDTVSTNFTVAHQAQVSRQEFPINPGDPHAVVHYASAPTLTPSTVTITTPAKSGASPGDLLLAPYQGDGSPGPMITEQDGQLVWFHPLPPGDESTNLRVQQYEGKPVLTWWQGRILQVGFGQGEDVLYNTAYQRVALVYAGNGYHADLHAFQLTPEGTAWLDVFDPIHANLSGYGSVANGVLTDSVIQEIDVKTGLVMWEWHALGHVPLAESRNPPQHSSYPWDYTHINSISPGREGDVLLSSRNMWALYDVDIASGRVRWQLGGEHSSLKLGPGTHTYWQHDAEFQPDGLISVFDNGADPPKEKQSRGLLLDANLATRTVSLVKQFVNPTKTLLSESQGNMLSLPDGNWLMGYGRLPNFTEYDSSGRVLFDGSLGKQVQDFRTYLGPWSGQPTNTSPSLVASPSGAGMSVSVSWNGATQVVSWQLLAGTAPGALSAVATATKSGFQTTLVTPAAGPYVQVQALDAAGAVIGTSATVKD